MSPSIVQFAAASGGTLTISATTAGSRLVVCTSVDTGTTQPTSVTLSGASDVFTQDVTAATTDAVANINQAIWSTPSCTGGKTSLVCSTSGAAVLMAAFEVTGTGTGSGPVAAGHGHASVPSTQETTFDSGAGASVPGGCFWCGFVTGIGNGGVRAQAVPSGAWTTETALQPGSVSQLLAAYQLGPSAGAPQYAGAFSAPSPAGAFWAASVAAYGIAAPSKKSGLVLASVV